MNRTSLLPSSLGGNKTAFEDDIHDIRLIQLVTHFKVFFPYFTTLPFLVVGCFGNLLVLVYFLLVSPSKSHLTTPDSFKKMSCYHFLIIQLGFTDFLASVFSALFHFKNEKWIFGDFTCKFLFVCLLYTSPSPRDS